MRKSEMSKKQLDERLFLIGYLEKYGWKNEHVMDWFEKDLWADIEAELSYANNNISLEVDYIASKEHLYFRFEDCLEGGLDIYLVYEDKLKDVLDIIIGMQDEITIENYQECLGRLFDVCSKIYTYVGEENDQLSVLVDDNDLSF